MVPDTVKGKIEFKDIEFAYPTHTEKSIFRALNLRIPDSSVVAVVGPSGCGKSTLISLIARFYEPSRGQVLLDGVSVQNIQLTWLRNQVRTAFFKVQAG